MAGVRASLNLVTARGRGSGLVGRPGGFEKALWAKFHRVGDFGRGERGASYGRRLQGNAGFRGPRQEKAHRPIAVNGMRAEEGKGVGVAGGKDGVDLRFETLIAGGNRCPVPHCWALLRQMGGLRDVANEGSAHQFSPKAGPRPLHSRALGRKCQTTHDGIAPARVARPSGGGSATRIVRRAEFGGNSARLGGAKEFPLGWLEGKYCTPQTIPGRAARV